MNPLISIIIPNYNGEKTLDLCLHAATSLKDHDIEIIVVDDGSDDRSIEIIKQYPCRLIESSQHAGASHARNLGAQQAQGEFIFFTDADCLIQKNTLPQVRSLLAQTGAHSIIGGTYTTQPYDSSFFSHFQSVFINYCESKMQHRADYIATHAMLINTELFLSSGGFSEDLWPILEDVEFSHRCRRAGAALVMHPAIQVQHIFNFSLFDSFSNAIRKTRYWIQYSLNNQDLLGDSGTASIELKLNVSIFFICLFLALSFAIANTTTLATILFLCCFNIFISRGLLIAFYHANGLKFGLAASCYYLLLYPLPVAAGTIAGFSDLLFKSARKTRYS